jgi:hypothetical protein
MDELNEYIKDDAIRKLERTLAELQQTSNKALGFVNTIEYRGVPFNISQRFVFADLAPLVFFHLIEHITDDVTSTIVRLYHRLGPLLLCQHDWVPLKRADDDQVRFIVGGAATSASGTGGMAPAAHDDPPAPSSGPYICRHCTAYILGRPLPAIGRDLA